jgi:hypothetical protein
MMRHVELTRQPLDLAGFARGLRAQAVIDGHHQQAWTSRQRFPPTRRKPHQGNRIRPARNGKDEPGHTCEIRKQTFRLSNRDRRFIVLKHCSAGWRMARTGPRPRAAI